MSLLLATNTGGALSIFTIASGSLLLLLIVIFLRNRNSYTIRKRSYTGSVVFALATLVTAVYLAVLVEVPEENVSCEMRHFELVTDFAGMVGTWVRGTQVVILGKVNLYLYANRKRLIEGRPFLKPDWWIRNAGTIGSFRNQFLFFGGIQMSVVLIWVIAAYGIKNADCSNPQLDLIYKSFVVIGSLSPFGAMYVTFNRREDRMRLRLEGNIDCAFTTVTLVLWGILRGIQDDTSQSSRTSSEIVLVVFCIWLHICSTIGMPLYFVFTTDRRYVRKDDDSASRITQSPSSFIESRIEYDDSEIELGAPAKVPKKLEDLLTGDQALLTRFLRQARQEYAIEGPEFLLQVQAFERRFRDVGDEFDRDAFNERARAIHNDFLAVHSPFTINIPGPMFDRIRPIMSTPSADADSDLQRWAELDSVYKEVYNLVTTNTFRRFRREMKKEREDYAREHGHEQAADRVSGVEI
mmetsp:Transcript_13736/g.15657  ORF Transcript_13736/g.15657 Transcript_13736/m.15657 type:complete len:466 (+) Transcript_13736:155-1552(+)|eukprot:CAMPEP_0184012780 /NCGR_PEP_ID=MMETSP0954-20121128/4631_1 /TAXON_ID=627963 /ORGANISM="Aplanochytrium sp, Strain PBS07" /LENGTH=465 /DNA_ID=CAMNT_0026292863 /DNA_START=203 /DNA_END=1600 /DNA_ORIENTATION=+